MNIKNLRSTVSLILAFALLASACSSGKTKWAYKRHGYYTSVVKKTRGTPSEVKLEVNDKVRAWLDYFQGPGRDRFGRYMERSGRYLPVMKEILKEHGLPEDLVYIAMIESGFTASACSTANAVGFWQFIRATGKRYGLRIDPFVDERRDFVKATHAAANYLTDLYNEFGDWHLAFAGYNAGEGRVRNALESCGNNKDFWFLSNHRRGNFRAETRDYVPKFIAAAILARNPKKYGFKVDYHPPVEFEETKVSSQADYEAIAKCAGTDVETISILNPELVMGITPPGERGYPVRVPMGKTAKFLTAFAKLPESERLTRDVRVASVGQSHTVRKGETLAKIARRYGVSAKELIAANHLGRTKHLKHGMTLMIPGKIVNAKRYGKGMTSDRVEIASSGTRGKFVKYKVKSGDTLDEIAERYGVEVSDIKKWNKIQKNNIAAGKKLKIYQKGGSSPAVSPEAPAEVEEVASADSPASKSSAAESSTSDRVTSKPATMRTKEVRYKVKKGDSLGKIASKHGVSVADLKKWNNITGTNIPIGRVLVVGKPAVRVAPAASSAETSSLSSAAPAALVTEVAEASTSPVVANMSSEASEPAAEFESSEPSASYYTVKSGDTLYSITGKNKISVAELCEINNISRTATLKPGMKLKLKAAVEGKKASVKPAASERMDMAKASTPAPKAKAAKVVTYKVKKGDTAWNIAKKHNVSVSEIKDWNLGTDLSKLRPGDVIKLKLASGKNM